MAVSRLRISRTIGWMYEWNAFMYKSFIEAAWEREREKEKEEIDSLLLSYH